MADTLSRARLGLALLLAGLLGMAPAAAWGKEEPVVPVRTESRAGFGRVEFDFASQVRFRITRDGDHVVVAFTSPRTIGAPAAMPTNVSSVAGGVGQAEIVVASGAQLRPGRIGNRIIIDVLDVVGPRPAPPSAPSQPMPSAEPGTSLPKPDPHPAADQAAASTKAVQVIPAPVAAAPAPAIPPAVPEEAKPGPVGAAERPDPPADPAGAGPVSLAAQPLAPAAGETGWSFTIPMDEGVGAAAFRRGSSGFVVFDERRPVDLSALRSIPALAGAVVRMLPGATVVRLPLGADTALALRAGPEGWVVSAGRLDIVAKPLGVAIVDHKLVLSAGAPGRVVTVVDDDGGTNILVGTQRQTGQGVAPGRHTPEFDLLASWQGVAVEPLSDRLTLTAGQDGFVLSAAPDGLALSPPEGTEALASAASITRRFNFAMMPPGDLMDRLRAEVGAAGAAPPLARGRKRRAAAETMIGLGMGAEAAALLKLASAEDAREAESVETQGLLAVASLLAERPEEADFIADPALDGTDEVALWRAVRIAQRQDGAPEAASVFAATIPLVLAYPAPLRARLLPLMAETMASPGASPGAPGGTAGDPLKAAESLLAARPDDPSLSLARAMVLEAKHDDATALAAYDAMAAGPDRLIRARALPRGVDLRLATGRIAPAEAADTLDRALFCWRGDRRELALRLRLAALRAEAGAWRPALTLLRDTEAAFPEQKPMVHARLQEVFTGLLQDRNAEQVPPLDFVSMVEDNPDLLPDGPAGEAAAAQIADRLTALDLPGRAGPVLDKLMSAAPTGSVKAALGARLAAARLREGDAAAALAALSASAAPDLQPALAEQRTLLFARATAGGGDIAGAVAALADLATPNADEARATILEAAKDWSGAEHALTDYTAKILPPEGRLDEAQRRSLLRLTSDAAQAGDEPMLAGLRRREAVRMEGGPLGDMFRLLTADPVRGVADLQRARQDVALARGLPGNLQALAAH